MTARGTLAPVGRVARSLPAAAVLVLAGLALVSLASSSRPTELDTIADGEGSLPSTTATTADATNTSEGTPSIAPTSPEEAGPSSTDQGETSPPTSTSASTSASTPTSTPASTPTSTSGDLQADDGADTSTGSATTDGSATTSTPADDADDNTDTTDADADTADADADASDSNDGQPSDADADGGTDGGAADGDDPETQAPADDADQNGEEAQTEPGEQDQGEGDQGEEDQGEEGDAALADNESPDEEDEQSFVQNALAVFIAIIAVLGLLSLLVPPLWSLIQRWRDRDKDESLRRVLWQWFRGLWSNGDEEVADSIKPAPLLNPIVMLDRLRTELESEPDPRSAVRKAYAAVESGFGDDEKARHTGETPTAYLERALGSLVEGENRPLAQLTYLFLLARYSQHDITEAMRNEAIDAVVELRSRYRQTEAVLV